MVEPVTMGIIAGAITLFGGKKAVDGTRLNARAKETQAKAEALSAKTIKRVRKKTSAAEKAIEKLGFAKMESWQGSLMGFVTEFEKIKNLELTGSHATETLYLNEFSDEKIGEIKAISSEVSQLGTAGATGVAAGAAAGALAWGGIGAFGAASTGAAITGLSGAAATNATLAWLGGGSIAAGGGGMAVGTLVLGSIVAAPIVAIGGFVFSKSAEANLNKAKQNKVEAQVQEQESQKLTRGLDAIKKVAKKFRGIIEELDALLAARVESLSLVIASNGCDYSSWERSDQASLRATVELAYLSKSILEAPLLAEGELVPGVQEQLGQWEHQLLELG